LKRKFCCLLFALFLFILPLFSACSAERSLETLEQFGGGFYCDEKIYTREFSQNGIGVLFCGASPLVYEQPKTFFGLGNAVNHYCSTSDYQVIGIFHTRENPLYCWGKFPDGGIWTASEPSAATKAFFEGNYSSYKLYSVDVTESVLERKLYTLAGTPREDTSYFYTSGTVYNGTMELGLGFILKESNGISVLGCNETGELGRVIGKVIKVHLSDVHYYYFPIDYGTTDVVTGYRLTSQGVNALETYLKNAEYYCPDATMNPSLEEIFQLERRPAETLNFVLISVAVLLVLVVVLIVFRRAVLSVWRKLLALVRGMIRRIALRRDAQRRKQELERTPAEERPLHISLTKEEIDRGMPQPSDREDPEEHRSMNNHFCPSCGAPCDWTSLRCATCGAELRIHGKRVVKINSAEEGRGISTGTLLDLDEVSFPDYLKNYAPAHLRRLTNRYSVWYFVLALAALFSSLLVYGDMLLLTQSVVVSALSLLPGFVLLVLAILYRRSRGLGYSIVFTVYGVLSVAGTVLVLFNAASLGIMALNTPYSVFTIVFQVIDCILYLFLSGFGLYRTAQLRSAYRDFKRGKGYRFE